MIAVLVTGHVRQRTNPCWRVTRHLPFIFGPHFCSMKITEDVRKYAAAQKISEEQALQVGLEQKAKEFNEAGAEVYAKA